MFLCCANLWTEAYLFRSIRDRIIWWWTFACTARQEICIQDWCSYLVQARHFSLFATLHKCQMKQMSRSFLTAFPLENWRRPPGRSGRLRLSSKTWNPITSHWTMQLNWLRIVHSGDWCTPTVVRQKRKKKESYVILMSNSFALLDCSVAMLCMRLVVNHLVMCDCV